MTVSTANRLVLTLQRMAGSILEKLRVFSVKIWTKTEIVLSCDGRRVDFGKTDLNMSLVILGVNRESGVSNRNIPLY